MSLPYTRQLFMSQLSHLRTAKQALNSMLILLLCSALLSISGCSDDSAQQVDPLKELAKNSEQFKQASADYRIRFPQDHAPQKEYRQEWWYLTANLTTEDGQKLASQWTLFRRGVEDKHWYFAHAALADANQHSSAYRNGREELKNVMINTTPFSASIDDWQWQSSAALLPATLVYGSAVGAIAEQQAAEEDQHWQVNLTLTSQESFFLQGEQGFSKKHANENIASHYYSQPFIEVSGKVFWQGKWQKVTGMAWFDREWGSQMLSQKQQGWDWFSLRLNKDTALMIFRVRSNEADYFYGSVMSRDGKIRSISSDEIEVVSRLNKRSEIDSPYPQSFSLVIDKENIDLEVNVVNEQQIMRFGIEYFEGMVTFTGSHQGEGFVEMTGYK
jgi:predicted secreted hydrolase